MLCKLCLLQVDGIRGDIVATRAARALAALEGHTQVGQRGEGVCVCVGAAWNHGPQQMERPWPCAPRCVLAWPCLHALAQVEPADVARVIVPALRHRLRKDPLAEVGHASFPSMLCCTCVQWCAALLHGLALLPERALLLHSQLAGLLGGPLSHAVVTITTFMHPCADGQRGAGCRGGREAAAWI